MGRCATEDLDLVIDQNETLSKSASRSSFMNIFGNDWTS